MKKLNVCLTAAVVALVLGAASCAQASSPAPAKSEVSPRVLTLGWTGDGTTWPNLSFGFYPLSGKTITQAAVTYAVNAATLTGLGGEWDVKNTGVAATKLADLSWTAPVDFPAASTWITITSLTTSATDNIGLKFWNNGSGANLLSLQKVVLTYSDASTETLTFVSDASAPVKSVTGSTTTYATLSSRVWTYLSGFTLATGYEAASF